MYMLNIVLNQNKDVFSGDSILDSRSHFSKQKADYSHGLNRGLLRNASCIIQNLFNVFKKFKVEVRM
jgi:hypothetical protein